MTFEFHGFRASATRSASPVPAYRFTLAPQVASHLWEAAAAEGLAPAGFQATEQVRIEDGRPSWAPDLAEGLSSEEVGLVDGHPRRTLSRILITGAGQVEAGGPVLRRGAPAGRITSVAPLPVLDGIAALAVIEGSISTTTELTVAGRDARLMVDEETL